MVRILSSGEIVPDDDERAQQENSSDRAKEVGIPPPHCVCTYGSPVDT